MTDTVALLSALNTAKAEALHAYEDDPSDDNHLRFQSLEELASAFEDMADNETIAHSLANHIPVSLALLESWVHAIARNRLYADDSSYLEAEQAIRAAAVAVLTVEEVAGAGTARVRLPRMYGAELDPDDAVFPFLSAPTIENLGELNAWLKNVGMATVRSASQRERDGQRL